MLDQVQIELLYRHGHYAAFVLGACLGSFLNVCIWRIPNNMSIITPGSHCPKCSHALSWHENIPILAWLLLRARCRWCKSRISVRYPLVEALVAILFVAVWQRAAEFGWPLPSLFVGWFLVCILVAVTLVDCDHRIIPNKFTYTGLVIALAAALIWPQTHALDRITAEFAQMVARCWDGIYGRRQIVVLDLVLGVILSGGVFWLFSAVGHVILGRDRQQLEPPATVVLTPDNLQIAAAEPTAWKDVLYTDADRVELIGKVVAADFKDPESDPTLAPGEDEVRIVADDMGINAGGVTVPMTAVGLVVVEARQIVLPRLAIGLGDVKLFAVLGAFFGPAGAVIVLVMSCSIGFVAGLGFGIVRLLRGRRWDGSICFGPYISVAALIYLLRRDEILSFVLWHWLRLG
ncbi:MAG: prepilin peptidase [Lentisphaeria bacterium]|nr:prepilin peptidase [Lentisphaeria bacterium]MDP7740614.1 prepilin peptidase [Lentisphaeria bacterium]